MTASDLTERADLEALALELGWAINQAGDKTLCGYGGHTITVTWCGCGSNNGATRAIITDADGQETARRETYGWQSSSVGNWVEMMLRAIVTARPAQGATA